MPSNGNSIAVWSYICGIFVVYVGISTLNYLHDPRPESNPRRHATDPAAFPLAPVLGRPY